MRHGRGGGAGLVIGLRRFGVVGAGRVHIIMIDFVWGVRIRRPARVERRGRGLVPGPCRSAGGGIILRSARRGTGIIVAGEGVARSGRHRRRGHRGVVGRGHACRAAAAAVRVERSGIGICLPLRPDGGVAVRSGEGAAAHGAGAGGDLPAVEGVARSGGRVKGRRSGIARAVGFAVKPRDRRVRGAAVIGAAVGIDRQRMGHIDRHALGGGGSRCAVKYVLGPDGGRVVIGVIRKRHALAVRAGRGDGRFAVRGGEGIAVG